MIKPTPRFVHPSTCLSILFLVVVALTPAVAQEQTIEVVRHGVATPLTLPEYKSQGIGYASMRDIARQLGAILEVNDARATFELDGRVAVAGLNDTEIDGGDAPFSLGHPVLSYEGDALIAMNDIVPFLRGSFGFGTPDAPPETSALAMESVLPDAEEPGTLEGAMETVALEEVAPPEPMVEESSIGLESIEIPSSAQPVPPTAGESLQGLARGDAFMLAIDPGHGGEDTGVVGPNGLLEKDLCLNVATQLRQLLNDRYSIPTIMTRDKDETLSAQARLSRAATGRATLILSIHGGTSEAPEARGYQVFSHKPKRSLSVDPKPALGAAQLLSTALDQATSQTPRPVRELSLVLMRQGDVPCILVELGNLSNAEDGAQLSAESYQSVLAAALAEGIHAAIGGTTPTGNPS